MAHLACELRRGYVVGMKISAIIVLCCVLMCACGSRADSTSSPSRSEGDNAPSVLFDEKSGWATDYIVLIDPTFDDASVYNAQMALMEWAAAVPVHFSIWVGGCDHAATGQICIHNGKTEFPDGGGPDENPNILGFTYWASTSADVYIYYEDGLYGGLQLLTFLHEIGHANCAGHHNGPYIMNPLLPPPGNVDALTPDDANQWFACRGLPTIPEEGGLLQ